MISLPRMGRMTQGTVFCGACADGYEALPVWGLVITARCDTAHDKVIVVNYLPVVRMEDWLGRHGGLLVLEKLQQDLRNKFVALLKKKNLSDSLLDVYAPSDIANDHFPTLGRDPVNNKERADEADRRKALDIASELAAVTAVLQKSPPEIPCPISLLTGRTAITQSILADLMSHKISGYYYLPNIGELTEHPSKHGYVAILREVRTIYRETARLIIEGLSRDKLDGDRTYTGLTFDVFDFLYPIAELQSPWIEHLLQVFCTMFGRIGLEDPDRSKALAIAESVFPPQESA